MHLWASGSGNVSLKSPFRKGNFSLNTRGGRFVLKRFLGLAWNSQIWNKNHKKIQGVWESFFFSFTVDTKKRQEFGTQPPSLPSPVGAENRISFMDLNISYHIKRFFLGQLPPYRDWGKVSFLSRSVHFKPKQTTCDWESGKTLDRFEHFIWNWLKVIGQSPTQHTYEGVGEKCFLC